MAFIIGYRSTVPVFVIAQEHAEWLYSRAEYYSVNPWDFNTRRQQQLEEVVAFVPKITNGQAMKYDPDFAMSSFRFMHAEASGQDPGPIPSPTPSSKTNFDEDACVLSRSRHGDDCVRRGAG